MSFTAAAKCSIPFQIMDIYRNNYFCLSTYIAVLGHKKNLEETDKLGLQRRESTIVSYCHLTISVCISLYDKKNVFLCQNFNTILSLKGKNEHLYC